MLVLPAMCQAHDGRHNIHAQLHRNTLSIKTKETYRWRHAQTKLYRHQEDAAIRWYTLKQVTMKTGL
jgi:hypothetical protein